MTMHSTSSSNTLQEPDPLEGAESGVWRSNDGRLSCGFFSFVGKRFSMEDRYDIREEQICTAAGTEAVYLFGIFDGHGGPHAAEYLKEHLFMNLIKHPNFITATDSAIRETYNRTDGDFLRAEVNSQRDDGSTASTAILVGNRLYIANVGDSRAVISKAGEAVQLCEDHKPNRTDERKRIENAGGVVMWAGTWRVGGVLAMSRAFGDRLLKQFVVADPEIQVETVDERLEYLVIASDGLWDSVSNEEAVKVVASESKLDVAARNLTKRALSGGSGDNITCIVVKFNHNATVAPVGPSSASSSDPQPMAPFPPMIAVDSSSVGTVGIPLSSSVTSSSSVGGVEPPLHRNAACPSAASLDLLLHKAAATSSAASTDPLLCGASAGSLSAGHVGSSAADSTLASSVGSFLNTTGADSTSAVSLDTTPTTRKYPSGGTAVFPSPIDAASSSAGSVHSSLDAIPPTT